MSEILRTLFRIHPNNEKLQPLLTHLVAQGTSNGWGNTRANSVAIEVLSEVLTFQNNDEQPYILCHNDGNKINYNEFKGIGYQEHLNTEGSLKFVSGPQDHPLMLWNRMSYLPKENGDQQHSKNMGFSITRDAKIYTNPNSLPIHSLVKAGESIDIIIGTIIEEHIMVINPHDSEFVAITLPFAAGLEPMNPNLDTSSKDAQPVGKTTIIADYILLKDDQVTYYFDHLPKGTYDFYIRTRATTMGSFTQPAAKIEKMYQQSVYGRSAGMRINVIENQNGAQ